MSGFQSKRAMARDKLQGDDMSNELKSLVDRFSDLLIRVLELENQKLLAHVLSSIADTDESINRGLLR